MSTLNITYDKENRQAREMLATMLASGLFYVNGSDDKDADSAIDYSDPWLYEDHGDLPPMPEGKETFTPEEALDIILKDIRQIYEEDAVRVPA